MTEQTLSKPWYKKWWGVVLTILFFPFVVPYLVWTQTNWNKWAKIGITLLCLAFIVYSNQSNTIKTESTTISNNNKKIEDNASDSTTKIEPTSAEEEKVIKRAIISGIDSDTNSGTYGELVVENINIWEKYGEQGGNRGAVIATLPHGTEVDVLKEKTTDQKYFKIRSSILKTAGWVSDNFITDSLPTPKPQREQTNTRTNNPTSTNSISLSQKNALAKAKTYLSFGAFSYSGLVKQLEYEQFSNADSVYGADNCGANWNEQAVKKAKSYMDFSAYSRGGLIDQLIYEGFTQEQADYGVNGVGL